jgi:hypothetical protein
VYGAHSHANFAATRSQRLECFIFKLKFNKEMDDLRHSLDTIRLATTEVITSKRLQRLLEIVLRVS